MYKILVLALSISLFSCNSSDSTPGSGGGGGIVVNLEDINKMREELSESWNSWKPESRNQRDIVTHIGGEVEESSDEFGPICHYIYSSIKYTTTWNQEADTFDLERELVNYTLGDRTSEDESICHLRANESTLGDSLGLGLSAILFLALDQLDSSDADMSSVPFDEIRPVSMVKRIKNGVKLWDLKYFISGTMDDLESIKLTSLKNLKMNSKFSGYLTVTFASEVPFTAWVIKSGYEFTMSDGTLIGGEELQVTSLNNKPID